MGRNDETLTGPTGSTHFSKISGL